MKRLLIGLPFLALVLAVAATTYKAPQPAPEAKDNPVLYWFTANGTYTLRQNTHANEVPQSGCPDQGATICERGYEAADLLDPANPGAGVKPGATPDDFIMRLP